MKKVFLMATILTLILVACNQKAKEVTTDSEMTTNDETMMENDTTMNSDESSEVMAEKMYSCPMHPEVQGKLNDKCSKCGMELTEPVAENAAE